jgi:hypothetical protein
MARVSHVSQRSAGQPRSVSSATRAAGSFSAHRMPVAVSRAEVVAKRATGLPSVRLLGAEAFSRAGRAVTSHRPFRAGGSGRLAMPKAGHVARNRLPHPVLACATGCMRAVCLTGGNAPASALSAPSRHSSPLPGRSILVVLSGECRGHRTPPSSSRSRNGSGEPDRQAAEPTPDPPVRHPQPAKLGRELPRPEQPDLVLFADVHQPDQRGVRQVEPEQSATRAEHPPDRVRTGDVMGWARRDCRRRERGSGLMAQG